MGGEEVKVGSVGVWVSYKEKNLVMKRRMEGGGRYGFMEDCFVNKNI